MRLPRLTEYPVAGADVPINRATLTEEQEQRIKRLLSFGNPDFFQKLHSGQDVTGIPKKIRAYLKGERTLWLPRHAPFQKLGIATPRRQILPLQNLPWEFTGQFRDYQEPAFAALRERLIYGKDGVMELRCGWGKTVLACAGFGWQQKPALAIVTQKFIAEQWRDALLQFTNIPKDHIGMVGDGYAEWDRDFVIAIINSIAAKDFPWQFYTRFGTVYFDEVHRCGAPLFSRVVPIFTGVRIGLTATLTRHDGMHDLFMLHVGPKFYEDKKQALIPRVHFLRTPVVKNVNGFVWKGNLNTAKLVSHLSKLDYRQEFVIDLIRDAYVRDRKVLLLSERKQELDAIQAALSRHEAIGRGESGLCVGTTTDGRPMSQETRMASLAKPIILATAQLVKEGLDKKDIDTLIIEYPQSSESFAEQSVGRILRTDDDKKPPVVVVLVDEVYTERQDGTRKHPFMAKAKRMQATFQRLGYTIVDEV